MNARRDAHTALIHEREVLEYVALMDEREVLEYVARKSLLLHESHSSACAARGQRNGLRRSVMETIFAAARAGFHGAFKLVCCSTETPRLI